MVLHWLNTCLFGVVLGATPICIPLKYKRLGVVQLREVIELGTTTLLYEEFNICQAVSCKVWC